MKTPFALILCCLLLLPGLGRGQSTKYYNIDGFHLSASGNNVIGFYKTFAPSVYSSFSGRGPMITEKRVRKVTVCYGPRQTFWYAVCFDTLGRQISQIRESEYGYGLVSDSIFAKGKHIVLEKVFRQNRYSARNYSYSQFHENDSSNLLVSLDSVIYTLDTSLQICIKKTYSFKMGNLINERNQYYNDLKLNKADLRAISVFKYFESGLNESQRYSEYADRHFVKKIPASYRYLYQHSNYKFPIRFQTTQLKTNYKANKFYNTSIKTQYIHKVYNPEKIKKLKPVYKYKTEGEEFKESDFIFQRESGGSFYCGSRGRIIHRGHEVTSDFFSRQMEHKNEKGFTDTLFEHSYYDTPQHPNQPCVKPPDDVDFYLDGLSGIPKKYVLFTFRYEYFDE